MFEDLTAVKAWLLWAGLGKQIDTLSEGLCYEDDGDTYRLIGKCEEMRAALLPLWEGKL
jgi:hypothetical protein